MKLILNRDTAVAGEHFKAGQTVDVPAGIGAYLVGHKVAVQHRDVTKVGSAPALPLPPMKLAPTDEDSETGDSTSKGQKGGK